MARVEESKFLPELPPLWARLAFAVAATGIMVAFRLGFFGHRVMPIAFGMPLVVFLWLRDRKLLWITAGIFAATTLFKYWFLSVAHEVGSVLTPTERAFDVIMVFLDLGVITVAIHVAIGAVTSLQTRNAELRASNAELRAREEEIERQNEELQSSAEELERQSEELRISNEELAQREHQLENLLELSRALHIGLDHNQALGRICEMLGHLVTGHGISTAILMDGPKGLEVRCHYGFGPMGIRNTIIPRDKSFAALVIEQARTGFLKNVSQRPDLMLPQPAVGEPNLSVLATPLVVRNKPVGTIELYSREPRQWSDEEMGLIESLAAQTATSLENAQLFDEVDEGRRRLSTILEQVPVGMNIASADLRDIRTNAAGAALLGVAPNTNIVSDPSWPGWKLFVDGKAVSGDRFPIFRAARGERVYPHEIEVMLPTGQRVNLLASASPFHDGEGKIMGAVSTFVDITQLKRLQRELEARRREAEEASVRKTRFLAAASHDIRTPANAISLLAELLKRTTDNPSMAGEIPQLAEELRNSATSLVNLVSNILDVTRFDTDKIELHETEFSLSQLVDEEVRQVLPLAQAKHLLVDCENLVTPIWMRADRIKLGRVLGNLLGNAIKFTDSGGVRCHCEHFDGGPISITVSDTGIGISPENQSRIFDEFWQLSDPSRSKGSGLGLSITKRLVEAMGGTIDVQSALGKGSSFTIRLPASHVVPAPDPQPSHV